MADALPGQAAPEQGMGMSPGLGGRLRALVSDVLQPQPEPRTPLREPRPGRGIPQTAGQIQRQGARSPLHPTDDMIARIAREEGVEELLPLIRAIGRQETGNNPVRTSVQDARGYFQIIPPTYRAMMGTLDGIEDPEQNTRAAVRYIRHLSRRVGNNPEFIAAGYFSGEGNVTRNGIRNPDRRDANKKSVRDYAREVVARIEPQ
ncbi:MAG: lytic transglycosylase domain-containing protein [Burkholderiales bacterium]|nr:lytic transglycosylase domain-containing protein [Burkholderiales bacterium]